jgi:hypothetical protein
VLQTGISVNETIGALAHLGLARAYTIEGDIAAAAASVSSHPPDNSCGLNRSMHSIPD